MRCLTSASRPYSRAMRERAMLSSSQLRMYPSVMRADCVVRTWRTGKGRRGMVARRSASGISALKRFLSFSLALDSASSTALGQSSLCFRIPRTAVHRPGFASPLNNTVRVASNLSPDDSAAMLISNALVSAPIASAAVNRAICPPAPLRSAFCARGRSAERERSLPSGSSPNISALARAAMPLNSVRAMFRSQ
ncbi:MAG: hypothetical protein BWY06_00595 [Candidatus Latescibacteria bacterium ADurb.Bin168]|nr:MAG: hypothetical protein BWY06_00595 [Candidatus Latescibacteria bacterium ADurb.Bin168]